MDADTADTLEVALPDEGHTARFGQDLAMALRPGDLLALSGDLGAGKTSLARAIIRTLADDPELDVPSPTFTLVQTYDGRLPVAHLDLYRLSSGSELEELGLDEALSEGAALVEWPERAEGRLPAGSIRIALTHSGEGRVALVSGSGPAFQRIARSLAIRDFLAASGRAYAVRRPFTGDASARSYETVEAGGEPVRVLMNSPALVLGPPVRNGKAYAEIAHTARSVAAFVAIDRALAEAGVAVPEILASDLDQGLLLTDHLGSGSFLGEDGEPLADRYAAAAELLAMMHGCSWPRRIEVAPGIVHEVPPFDRDALAIEVDLLPQWYVPWSTGKPADAALIEAFEAVWNTVFDRLERAEKSIVLRDVHSPNIVWRGERQGFDRLGMVDFQDAMIGPSAYDVASLAMDARVTISREIERSTFAAYVAARRRADETFDVAAFEETYAIMAAQRNTKILGIFVRLDRRDGKPAYLKHLPRIRDYLSRAFAHPALEPLRALYAEHGFLGEVSP